MCEKRMYSIFKGFIICGIKMLYDISTAKDFNCQKYVFFKNE